MIVRGIARKRKGKHCANLRRRAGKGLKSKTMPPELGLKPKMRAEATWLNGGVSGDRIS
jgi:hypothetical protein